MPTWEDGTCNEKSGFLFTHECFQSPIAQCQQCGKPICEDHSHELPDGTFCTSCARGHIQQRPKQPSQIDKYSRSDTTYHDPYYNDPYLYGSSYYYGYHWGWHSGYSSGRHSSTSHSSTPSSSGVPTGNDPMDFTEADGDSLEIERDDDGDADQFEKDMSES
jgi:hypothetical protein